MSQLTGTNFSLCTIGVPCITDILLGFNREINVSLNDIKDSSTSKITSAIIAEAMFTYMENKIITFGLYNVKTKKKIILYDYNNIFYFILFYFFKEWANQCLLDINDYNINDYVTFGLYRFEGRTHGFIGNNWSYFDNNQGFIFCVIDNKHNITKLGNIFHKTLMTIDMNIQDCIDIICFIFYRKNVYNDITIFTCMNKKDINTVTVHDCKKQCLYKKFNI